MPEETHVDVNGTNLFCHSEGPGGDAPWIVFSNSLVTDLSIWDAQVAAFGDRYNTLRYDQRGHGRSPATKEPLDFDCLGDDLLVVLDHFNVERCALVGLSMGVPTALRAYTQDPARFNSLVFVDGMARTAATGAAAWQERIDLVEENGMSGFAQATAARWLQADTMTTAKGETLLSMIAATSKDGFIQCVRALQDYDYSSVVTKIDIPVLAIAGAEDGAMPATMERTFGAVPDALIRTVPNAGHVPNFERPEAFNALLGEFLELTS